LEKVVQAERLKRLARDMDAHDKENENPEDQTHFDCFVVHDAGHGVVDTACQLSVIGEETLQEHESVCGKELEWTSDPPRRFKGFTGEGVMSKGCVMIPWVMGDQVREIKVHVVPGPAGLLLSKRQLKEFGAVIDMGTDTLMLNNLGVVLPMSETVGEHYSVDLTGGKLLKPQPFQ
jgi:hypothetical protein